VSVEAVVIPKTNASKNQKRQNFWQVSLFGEGCSWKWLFWRERRKDVAYIKYLLSQSKDITFCDDPLQADAVIVDAELLTPAEKEVLKALSDYGSVEEVAAKTFRAKATVKKHLCSARKKLKAKTNIQAVAFAIRYRLIRWLSSKGSYPDVLAESVLKVKSFLHMLRALTHRWDKGHGTWDTGWWHNDGAPILVGELSEGRASVRPKISARQ